ncbi:hypothetical protein EMO91_10210 [Bifidobacterium myosotis]|uniref:Uncharacterized protein n=2 Tax=Bifidobacterium myosotis TaxID=1630166 RepID=A0A5M9ZJA8_9BIFI|nr:hypothetical protein EMO91_10210 [Bifidobacterium myosotis]
MQYRARRVDGMLLEPARDAMLLRNRDGHHYLVDGPRTWLILGPDGALPAPDGMAPGIYREADRPNTLWLRDADGLKRPRLAPASIIDGYAPWFRLAVRHDGFRLSYRPF